VIITSNKDVVLPSECPECKTETTFDGIHLMCPNEKCPGKIAKIIATGSGVLDLKGIGSERLKPFAKDFINIFQIWVFVLRMGGDDLGKYGLEPGTRLNEIFVNAFKNIKSIPYEKIIRILGYENVGRKISQQLAREHAGLDFSYASLERALVDRVHTEEVESYIKDAVSVLETFGVIVDRPVAPKTDTLGVVMTGSPKVFGFKTKKEFLIKYPNLVECSMTDAICKYLITDDLSSTSSKMKAANKKGIEIKTYGDF
jgi:NAD-dependent DNA ligase